MTLPKPNRLVDCIQQVLIIAYRENTDELVDFFTRSNFTCQVIRQQDNPEYEKYSPSYRCLLNHDKAWQMAMLGDKPTIIIEADFVPVINFPHLPLPFPLDKKNEMGISWLYTCAPQIYSVSKENYAQGFSTSAVAYIVTPQSAKALLEIKEKIRLQHGNSYSTWDSKIDEFLRNHRFKNFIPFRNYGEHGGLPNLEHVQNGLSKTHRADVLYGNLAFSPIYADHSYPKLLLARLQARIKGIGRLITGRFIRFSVLKNSSTPMRLIRFAFLRHFSLY